jgi:hypothetical protein
MQSPQPSSSWLGRNWKWAVPLGCLTGIALFIAILAGIVLLVFGLIAKSDVYTYALAQARSSPAVAEALGEPIEPGWYLMGTINVSGASGNADIAIPISGPSGAGTLYASARKRAGAWNYDVLEVALDAGGERINLRTP